MSFQRIAGIAGIVFVALLVVNGVMLGDQPYVNDSIADVRSYVGSDESMHKTGLFIGMLVLPFAVLFFAGLVARLRASDIAHAEGWSVVTLLGAVLFGASAGVGDVLYATTVFRGGEGLDDATLRVLWDGQNIAYASMGIALTALALGVAVPVLERGLWPFWYGLLTLVAAALGVVTLIGVISDTSSAWLFIGFITFGVWTLVTGVLMVVTAAAATAGEGVVPPSAPSPTTPAMTA